MRAAPFNLILFVFIVCFHSFSPVESTVCKPLSSFRVDCNDCRCSRDGREYSCTQKICTVDYKKQFVQERNLAGYTILKPKKPNADVNDVNKARKLRHVNIPYINDAIDVSDTTDNNIRDNNYEYKEYSN